MKRLLQSLRRNLNRRSQVGQSVIMLAIALVMLMVFVGLVTDIALLFVRFSTLRRAVDAAALAAAGQIREDSNYLKMVQAAYQYIELHGVGVQDISDIFVETCDTVPGDPELCPLSETDLPRKMVRVTAQIESPTTFLSLLGMGSIRLQATAIGETAVIDLALVLDTSESMSELTCYKGLGNALVYPDGSCPGNDYAEVEQYFDPTDAQYVPNANRLPLPPPTLSTFSPGSSGRNDQNWGYYCNDPNGDGWFNDLVCNPFKNVRIAASNFIKKMDFVRGDRVVIVTFDRYAVVRYPDCELQNPYMPHLPCVNSDWTQYPMISDKQTAEEVLLGVPGNVQRRGVGVYVSQNRNGGIKGWQWNKCWVMRQENGLLVPEAEGGYQYTDDYTALAACGNTNIGGGIETANSMLSGGPAGTWKNPAAVWVMVLLSDGAANATTEYPDLIVNYPSGFCPELTFADGAPYCRDDYAYTRHEYDDDNPGTGVAGFRYDADDYSRDRADDAGLADTGNFIAMFAIGLGREMIAGDGAEPWHGEALLRYISDVGDNGVRDGTGDYERLYDADQGRYILVTDPNPASVSECENRAHGDPSRLDASGHWINPITDDPSCGNYFFVDDPNQGLERVFAEIASRMFTRVTR
ncbi:MAG: VWA domain-containing protein [Anaerolineae bacterium]|nr:VWA domain-containing protein [Anaerolineae bacterium]